MELNINFSKKHFYTLLFFTVLMTTAIFVYAYGSSSPATFGHSAGELIVNSTSIVDGSITGADITNNTLNASHMQINSLTGAVINESSLGIVPNSSNSNACNNDGICEITTAAITNWQTQSLATNGYAKIGSLKIQWGRIIGGAEGASYAVTFPTTFSSVYNVQCSPAYTSTFAGSEDTWCVVGLSTLTTSGVTLAVQWSGTGSNQLDYIYWTAIGT